MTLLDATLSIEPQLRRRISAIRIRWEAGVVTAHFNILLFTAPRGRATPGGYTVTVDTSNIPDSVALAGVERHPGIDRELATEPDMARQIADLNESGLLGSLDAARFDGGAAAVKAGHAPVSWVVKTHAGSDIERIAWLQTCA